MKKIIYLSVIFSLMILFPTASLAAGGRKNSKTVDGFWQVVQIRSKMLDPKDEEAPYITLNSLKKNMSGNSGCNYIHSRIAVNARKRTLSFEAVASTRMACRNAERENEFMELLQKAALYRIEPNGNSEDLVLYAENDEFLLKLSRRMPLDGKWMVRKVNNKDLEKLGDDIFLVFNSAEQQIYGYLGCNSYNASMEYDAQKESLIKVGDGMKTLRMCDKMDVEDRMVRALSEIVSYKKFSDRKAILCNAGGKVLIELTR